MPELCVTWEHGVSSPITGPCGVMGSEESQPEVLGRVLPVGVSCSGSHTPGPLLSRKLSDEQHGGPSLSAGRPALTFILKTIR